MAELTLTLARHRIIYTPKSGKEMILLDVGELADSEPAFESSIQVESTPLLGRAWAHHRSKGNAELTLGFDVHRPAGSPAAARAMGMEMWRYILTHPEGMIRYQTAFLRSKSDPLVDWQLQASCSGVEYADVDIDTSPFARAASCHMRYNFTVSLPE